MNLLSKKLCEEYSMFAEKEIIIEKRKNHEWNNENYF